MKPFQNLISLAFILISALFAQPAQQIPLKKVINETLDFSVQQSLRLARSLENRHGALPKTTDQNGNLETCTSKWWTSGFFPGMLWYLYEYSGNDSIKKHAEKFTARVVQEQFTTDNHDVGFIINCSFGNGYRLTGDTTYKNVLRTAAHSLATRFNPIIGCIRSWDYAEWNKRWQYPVIIDNMMNLELLMVVEKEFHEERLSAIAKTHANTTIKNHFRPNYSSFHVVSYDTISGNVQMKQTAQGYNDGSSWARGQAWGLYGFTMMYRCTNDSVYLSQAQRVADFIIHHTRLPKDKIPFWDFDAPDIPNTYRDASAAAIICSALIELSRYVSPETGKEYLSVAETQLRTLSSPDYCSRLGGNANFILNHGIGNIPNKTEINVPLPYLDYYFVEALLRMKHSAGL